MHNLIHNHLYVRKVSRRRGAATLVSVLVLCFVFSGSARAQQPYQSRAQQVSISTNLIEWLNLGTINGEFGVSVSRHFSIHASARYNPWTFRKGDVQARYEDPVGDSEKQFENRKQAYGLSVRWWPWYIYSGWWWSVKGQYMEYNRGGIFNHTAEEGDSVGGGGAVGYTHMLHKHWNIEFGAGVWAGSSKYTKYRCTNCGTKMEEGTKFFVLPDEVFVSIIYVF